MKNIIFKEKNSLKEAIPFIALLSCLSIILIIFITYFPLTSLVLSFVLPLPSIICVLYTKYRYYLIYAFSTLILSLTCTFMDISYTLFNLIPILICAFIIGILIKNKFNIISIICFASLIMTFLNILILFIFNKFFNINLIQTILNLLKINQTNNFNVFILSFIYLYSLINVFLMVLISFDYIKKIYNHEYKNKYDLIINYSFILLTILLSLICYQYSIEFFYLFFFISILFSILFFNFKEKTLQNSIIFIVFLIISWIFYILFYTKFILIKSFVLLLIFPLLLSLYQINFFLFKIRKNKSII